ncbi:DUF29 domain-containing protein [Allochromatium tepidum]|uniref:DUF29 domain-containing protein n=1 Tax=Allochromatium tepidum TaxID=553982 RepID=UPI001F24CB85|nr:DUF29 domain-containing protein [Allochromatium tepidum]
MLEQAHAGQAIILAKASKPYARLIFAEKLMTAPGYNEDFFLWTQQQAALLRQGQWSTLDAANLAEEIESMGKSDRRSLASHLITLLLHRLKWDYQPTRRGTSWRLSIRNARREIGLILDDSPSLRRQLPDLIETAYATARRDAAEETGLPLATFPECCPFAIERLLDDTQPDTFAPPNTKSTTPA